MKSIYNLLFSLGLHIGNYNYLSNLESYKYLLGTRNDVAIFDIQILFHQIRYTSLFLGELGKQKAFLLFYHSNIINFPIYLKFFLINLISLRYNQAFLDQKWSFGQLSNSSTQIRILFDSLFYLDTKSKKERKHVYSIYELLHRILFFTIYKRLEGVSWDDTFDSVKKYWRLFYFFKYYSFCKVSPDCLLFINTNNLQIPTLEAESINIPTVLVGNNSINLKSSYLITSNNSSYLVSIFYFVLFLNNYNLGVLDIYKKIYTNFRH
jgi:ribosomal protein S2